MFMAADSGDDWTFTLSGPAAVTRTDGDHIFFRGTGDGTIAFTAHSPTQTPAPGRRAPTSAPWPEPSKTRPPPRS
jgi:hypothetical protein